MTDLPLPKACLNDGKADFYDFRVKTSQALKE